jgi:hypothetical protein
VKADPIDVAEEAPSTVSREALADEVTLKMIAEGTPPITARIIAETYATSVELERILGAIDNLADSGPLGKMFARAIGGRS